MTIPCCRFCDQELRHVLCDLGVSPMANSYIAFEDGNKPEPLYPLKVWVCQKCLLAQLESFESPEHIFSDYLYFSSYSDSWVGHAKRYCEAVTKRFDLNSDSFVVEIASNDGYLLQHFKADGVPVLGVEPAANVAEVAERERDIPTRVEFFGVESAGRLVEEGRPADLVLGNNVLAHVPDINDFVGGVKVLLKPNGVNTFEFPHLLNLIQKNQFDTVYHEHFSYLSFLAIDNVFSHHDLTLFDVEQLPTHGGSLRIYARHAECDDPRLAVTDRVAAMRQLERDFGLEDMATYEAFSEQVRATKRSLLRFLIDVKEAGKTIVGYGAAAKGVTLINYCGIGSDLLDFVVDRNPHKQNRYMPGVRIPILPVEAIDEAKPDYVLILPWNLRDEIKQQMAHIAEWGGKFVVPIPEVQVI